MHTLSSMLDTHLIKNKKKYKKTVGTHTTQEQPHNTGHMAMPKTIAHKNK